MEEKPHFAIFGGNTVLRKMLSGIFEFTVVFLRSAQMAFF